MTARGDLAAPAIQPTLDELGRPLHEVTFCVFDLETTGGSAADGARITEFGAVKVRAGEVLGEFQSLVNPQTPIPPFIAVLTGITDAMVAQAPRIEAVLPAFLEFAAGSVLVAHNASFDTGFLRHFVAASEHRWPDFEVLDTVRLARHTLTRDEVPNCKLATLARLFGSATTPNHRALYDARATVDVLHGLIGRLGNLGVQTLEELQTYTSRVHPEQRRKRHLADDLPHAPGVYLFRDSRGRALYVGKSKDLRARVRTYFTASETRSRMGEMVRLAETVEGIPCTTALEAEVRELRLIATHKPSYNRRSRHPERVVWLKLTNEPWPRLSLVRQVLDDQGVYVGPFGSRRTAEQAMAAVHEAFPLRQCTGRLPYQPSRSACILAEMGRCLSPCDGSATDTAYGAVVTAVRQALVADPETVVEANLGRISTLAADQRYEDAGMHRDRLGAFLRGTARTQRLDGLTHCRQLVAARRLEDRRGWEMHVVRYGRLAAAGVMEPGVNARSYVAGLVASAESVEGGPGPTPAASAAESECILRWLESPGIRLVELDGTWTCPVRGAGGQIAPIAHAEAARADLVPFDERRPLATVHQP